MKDKVRTKGLNGLKAPIAKEKEGNLWQFFHGVAVFLIWIKIKQQKYTIITFGRQRRQTKA
jgi:hypothetical protein